MSRLLPPHLSVNLPTMEKTTSSELTPTRLGFPNEFPYEFDSPSFSPGFTSPGDSTETEDESSDDEEDFLAGLTRRLAPSTQRLPSPLFKSEEKRQVAATSPQSTLSGLGSFSNSGSRSPILPSPPAPTSSFRRDNAWDVISAAAGEVARLKLGSYEPHHLPLQTPESLLRRQNAAIHAELQHQRLIEQMWLCSAQSRFKLSENRIPRRVVNEEGLFENPRYMRRNNPTWLPPQQAAAPLKRPSAGTGVFLPRRYPSAAPSDSLKTPVNTPAMLQPKVKPQNLNFDEFTNIVGPRRSQFDYECMLARSTVLARQGNFRAVSGGGLPQDWMY
ncbi:hypothetical protein ISN45_At02g034810 [Arabidopsis thaliana x Arabidopsis arenosa]|uniref:Uncharacterized protein n=2 Tax=Arabidopsis TaxID=3701 RepID=A0A178VY61_ARATH|nr:hypothetical protein ISN45_At02g034810 [Arabidopsis thaliana x Arabidopsis arenosa]OAP10878.1 hypothetical protein AXX17_AT2G36860 [Arabidopsis thaliana]